MDGRFPGLVRSELCANSILINDFNMLKRTEKLATDACTGLTCPGESHAGKCAPALFVVRRLGAKKNSVWCENDTNNNNNDNNIMFTLTFRFLEVGHWSCFIFKNCSKFCTQTFERLIFNVRLLHHFYVLFLISKICSLYRNVLAPLNTPACATWSGFAQVVTEHLHLLWISVNLHNVPEIEGSPSLQGGVGFHGHAPLEGLPYALSLQVGRGDHYQKHGTVTQTNSTHEPFVRLRSSFLLT